MTASDELVTLAADHRRTWAKSPSAHPRHVIAITGTSGKSTTRRLLAALLRAATGAEVVENRGDQTSTRDLTRCLLSLRPSTAACVLEVSARRRGDLSRLGAMIAPDVGALTLVAVGHSDALGSIEQIEQEKGDLLRRSATASANADDHRALRQRITARATGVTWGTAASADYRVLLRASRGLVGSVVSVARPRDVPLLVDAPVFGAAGALAVAAAIALAEQSLGYSLELAVVQRAFASVCGEVERFFPRQLADGTVVLVDSADATPISMQSAIVIARELATHESRRLVVVAGGMGSLGNASLGAHTAVGVACARAKADVVLVCGREASPIGIATLAHGIPTHFARDRHLAANLLTDLLRPGDFVLFTSGRDAPMKFLSEVVLRTSHGASPRAA